ncbi:hypothetical protein [Citrobacter portucalensis]|uniref:hypothetical protein n=1 Tax=Citrobacter portucalensis TaxID=1639133 RepID=UPI003CECC15A
MQVGLKTTTAHTPATFTRGGADASQTIQRSAAVSTPLARNVFPEAALLSRRPLRYNVQLNQQLTAIQQADDYLAQTENHLLRLRQAFNRGDASRQFGTLKSHLERRQQLSGGTVDRNLIPSVQQSNSVNFTLPGSEKLVLNPGGEMLVFALGGRERQLAAIALPAEATPPQTLTQLNVGLGRLGIRASHAANGQLTFQVAESQWDRVSQQLSVRGEGRHFPADSFTLLVPQVEVASSDEMLNITQRRERDSLQIMQKMLNHITAQRSQLRQQQLNVSLRIDDMATVYSSQKALETSEALAQHLSTGAKQFTTLSTVLGVQANVSAGTVKNLLG